MKRLFVAVALTATGASYASGLIKCEVLDATIKNSGKTKIEVVTNRDSKVIGEVFSVQTRSGDIKGSLIYQTEGHKLEVLRSSPDEFSVLIRDAGVAGDDDVSVITLEKFNGAWTFKHYSSWIGLMTSGSCKEF